MVYSIIDNIIIIVLTLICAFFNGIPTVAIICGGVLMVLVTYLSLSEDKSTIENVLMFLGVTVFSLASGFFVGYIVYIFCREIKAYMRCIIATVFYAFAQSVIYRNVSVAICIVHIIVIVLLMSVIMLCFELIRRIEDIKRRNTAKITASNVSELHEKRLNEQLILQNVLAEKNARLMERENISRNIHNSVGHSITAAIMTLDAADMLYEVKPDDARKKMNDANERMRGSLESIRRAVRVLDEDSADIVASDLKLSMKSIINEFVMDTNIKVDESFVQLEDSVRIPHDYVEFLTGVLQELLTNGVKHGNADEFVAILLGDNAHIRLEVSDNGKSDFGDANSQYRIDNGFGIKKIISYAKKHGGKTSFINDNGFKSMIELPIVSINEEG